MRDFKKLPSPEYIYIQILPTSTSANGCLQGPGTSINFELSKKSLLVVSIRDETKSTNRHEVMFM